VEVEVGEVAVAVVVVEAVEEVEEVARQEDRLQHQWPLQHLKQRVSWVIPQPSSQGIDPTSSDSAASLLCIGN
jgi:hypothetical protein